MKLYLIANPHARNGRGRRKLEELCDLLRRRALRYELALCDGLDHARELSRNANLAGYDRIVAVGGDGTINRVLNGFFDADGRRLSSARLGVVHIGTSPDFCRSHGVPVEVGPAVEVLCSDVARPVSVGRIMYEKPHRASGDVERPTPGSAIFGCCANIGLGASLARLANGGIRKYAGDFLGTLLSLLRLLLRYRPRVLQLTMDGEQRRLLGVYNISVGKTAYIASGIKVRHELREQDDRFYVLTVRNLAWHNFSRVLHALYRGCPIQSDSCLSLEYARTVRLASCEDTVEVEFDGDPAGQCPCRIETAADTLDLLVNALHFSVREKSSANCRNTLNNMPDGDSRPKATGCVALQTLRESRMRSETGEAFGVRGIPALLPPECPFQEYGLLAPFPIPDSSCV